MKRLGKILIGLIFLIAVGLIVGWVLLGPAGNTDEQVVLVVPQDKKDFNLVEALDNQGLIKNALVFQFLTDLSDVSNKIESGGYRLESKMNSLQILKQLSQKPDLFWVVISSCQRREQIGEKLASKLGWSEDVLNQWDNAYQSLGSDYIEGVYYPDTYLLPVDETGQQIAQRFIDRFNEKFSPLGDDFVAKNIKWTTGLKIASLIAREAAGSQDMKLISGIIWNRLDKNMPLEIDSTMQYTAGKNADGSWWGRIDLSEKRADSPYNSYRNKGLPPTPICSPNIEAIEAALNPQQTDCLYYLHDQDKQIHCSQTYEEHLENIDRYLR